MAPATLGISHQQEDLETRVAEGALGHWHGNAVIRGHHQDCVLHELVFLQHLQHRTQALVKVPDHALKGSDFLTGLWPVVKVGGHGEAQRGIRRNARHAPGTVGLEAAHLAEKRVRPGAPGQGRLESACQFRDPETQIDAIKAQCVRISRFVLDSKQPRLIAIRPKEHGRRPLVGVQGPGIVLVGESQDAVAVGIAAGHEGGPAWAALRCCAERVLEQHRFCCKSLEIGRVHGLHAIGRYEAACVMRDEQEDIRSIRHSVHSSPGASVWF